MSRKSNQSTGYRAPSGSPASVGDRHRLLTLAATIALLVTLTVGLASCDTTSTIRFPTLTPTPIPVITEFPLPTDKSQPREITVGSDGAPWFTESSGNKIGRITPNGAITEFPLPETKASLGGITAGPDGALWFTEALDVNSIGRMTVDDAIARFPLPNPDSQPYEIMVGPDGNLWFTEDRGNRIGRITPAGEITEDAAIGRLSVTGVYTEFPLSPESLPDNSATGPDGALWFTDQETNQVSRITTSSAITGFYLLTPDSRPFGIVSGR